MFSSPDVLVMTEDFFNLQPNEIVVDWYNEMFVEAVLTEDNLKKP